MCKRRKMVILPVVLCCLLGILFLKEPVLAAEGFANGLRLCTSTVLPALFPFFVLTDLLLTCPLRNRIFRPAARLLGLENEIAIPVLVLSWVGGYAVCAKMVGNLQKNRLLNARDAALVILLGCCSSPGFVIGCVGGLLMGNVRLGILFYWLQLAANLAAAALCIGLLPRKTAQSVSPKATVPESLSFSNAIGNAVGSCLQVCGCVLFFRMTEAVLVPFLPQTALTIPVMSAFLEISAGCSDFAALGGRYALYGCCTCLSVLGLSVWAQISLLLQGAVPLRLLLVHRTVHLFVFLAMVGLLVRFLPGTVVVYRSMAARVVTTQRLPWDAAVLVFAFLCASLYKVRQNFYNK